MSNEAIQVLTTPSWVEISMLVATILYFGATCLIFIVNRKSAKATVIAGNVALLDKRLEIINELRELSHEHASSYSKNNAHRIRLLFPRQIYNSYDSYILHLVKYDTQLEEYYVYVNDLNNLIFYMITKIPCSCLDDAIQKYTDEEQYEYSKELVEIISEAKRLILEQNKKWEDPMKRYSELRDLEYTNKLGRATLLISIEKYIHSTIN